jgi:hypothetical protein
LVRNPQRSAGIAEGILNRRSASSHGQHFEIQYSLFDILRFKDISRICPKFARIVYNAASLILARRHPYEFLEMRIFDGNNPNLAPFKKAGGKIIIVGSWNSTALPTRTLSEYHEQVEKVMGVLSRTQDFARLFMVPGSSGCPGFMGGQRDFDSFSAIQNWAEKGVAPESIIFNQGGQGARGQQAQIPRSRPACVYPKVVKYKGSGDINDAANFTCVASAK